MVYPLSVSASVVGLLAAGAKLVSLISRISDPPQVLAEIKSELISLEVVINGLKAFVTRTRSISSARVGLIPLQDVIPIFTQIVLVHSELEAFIQTRSSKSELTQKIREAFGLDAKAADRLLK